MFTRRPSGLPKRNRQFIRQDFIAYQESILEELRSVQDRVRNLIGQEHWLTDGEHKETALKNILRSRLPDTMRVSQGFVCYPREGRSSGQLDILITPKQHPSLYQDGDLIFVTAGAVRAIVEIKTRLRPGRATNPSTLVSALSQLADRAQFIREHGNTDCWCGLFIYDDDRITHENLLRALQDAAAGLENRAVNCVSAGDNLFAHYWTTGRDQVDSPIAGQVWHSYDIHRLAPAYFVSNIVVHVSPDIPDDEQLAWFPIQRGKETQRLCYIPLSDGNVSYFAS